MEKYIPLNKILTKYCTIILLLVALFSSSLSYAQCPGGTLTLTTQTEIDDFSTDYPGCTAIAGGLTIDESVAGNITNLNGLTALTSVGGVLKITTNTALTDLSGLDNITSVGGNLLININTMLSSLSGLDNVVSVGGFLYFENNSTLSSLSALNNLTSINGILLVKDCPALTSLSGLDNITSIAGYLRIQNNATLANLNGLANVISVGGYLTINNNDALLSLSGLDNVASIGGILTISNNAMITSLSSLDNIAPAGITNLLIQNNPLLSICEISSICNYLDIPANTATISGNASGCSSRAEVESACLALPVELISFSGRIEDNRAKLNWQTASELNNEGFEIQRATDGEDFKKIGWVTGQGTSDAISNYTFEERDILPNTFYYYRLNQIDFDGKHEYSSVIAVRLADEDNIYDITFVPNPVANGFTKLQINTSIAEYVNITLFDAMGRLVYRKDVQATKGLNQIRLDLKDLQNGVYLSHINMGNQHINTLLQIIR